MSEEIETITARYTPYQRKNYLYFGARGIGRTVSATETADYLNSLGLKDNPLEQAAKSREAALMEDSDYKPSNPGCHYCDFCSAVIEGAEYEILDSGLERCMQCSKTALRTQEQFVRLFKRARQDMEIFFGIILGNIPVKVRMVSAKKISQYTKVKLIPTPGFDSRVLGFALRDKDGFALYIENGSPKISAMSTIVHELTHIWQYKNWNDKVLSKKYGSKNLLMLYEGMAEWAEVQYMYYINEIGYGKRMQIRELKRDDIYGIGLQLFLSRYPMHYSARAGADNPFGHPGQPL